MSLKDIDITSALSRLADRKIEQAIQEGKFDKIEGMGQPLDLEPLPADENARMQWWALRILRKNDITPDEVRWRKQLDGLRDELDRATNEPRVRQLVSAHNQLVKQVNTLGTNALTAPVRPIVAEDELAKLRGRQAVATIAAETMAGPTGDDTPSNSATTSTTAMTTSQFAMSAGKATAADIRTCANVAVEAEIPGGRTSADGAEAGSNRWRVGPRPFPVTRASCPCERAGSRKGC